MDAELAGSLDGVDGFGSVDLRDKFFRVRCLSAAVAGKRPRSMPFDQIVIVIMVFYHYDLP